MNELNGNVAALTDASGATLGTYEYSPYGRTTITGNVAFNPIRWLASWQETTTSEQTYKLGARYYQTNGAFTQPDPITGNQTDPRTLTAYNYAGGDPINQQDASGYSAGEVFGGALSVFKAASLVSDAYGIYSDFSTGNTRGGIAGIAGLAVGGATVGACTYFSSGTLAAVGVCTVFGLIAAQTTDNPVRYGRPYRFYGE